MGSKGDSWEEGPRLASESGELSEVADSARAAEPAVSLMRLVGRALRRKRWATGLSAALRVAPWALLGASLAVVGARSAGEAGLPWGAAGWLVAVGSASCVLVAGWRAARAVKPLAVALELDRALGHRGQLAAAYDWATFQGGARARAFSSLLSRRMGGLTGAKVDEALPLRVATPWWGLGGALVLLASSTAPLPGSAPPPPSPHSPTEPQLRAWMLGDDAELLQDRSQELSEQMDSKTGRGLAERFNEIVVQAASGAVSQQEAFRLAARLESEVTEQAAATDALAQGLRERGRALSQFSSTEDAGQALSEGRWRDAEQALRRLAERLENAEEGLSQQELDDLRESIGEMRKEVEEARKGNAAEQESSRASLERRIQELEEKERAGKASGEQKRELERKRRELKRLNRQKKQTAQSSPRELSELDKQLAEAARQLAQERKKSSEFVEQAAQTVSESAARQLSDEEKRELIRQLKVLKERLRKQNAQGAQVKRMQRFQQRARGQRSGQRPGAGTKQGQGQSGKTKITLGPNGQPLPLPGEGQGQGNPGQEGAVGQAEGSASGQEPGQGHEPKVAGEADRLEGAQSVDSAAVAQDTGSGQSASETIRTAAEEGFSAASYERLFVEYETVAEEKMQQMDIPAGRRSQVLRYFELIRPRRGEQTQK